MRVLWIVNIPLPKISAVLGLKEVPGGGWMEALANKLVEENSDLELAIACCAPSKYVCAKIDGITYYVLPTLKPIKRYDISLEKKWRIITEEFKPDVVHINGTEFAHSLSYLNSCGNDRVCVSIQGLISVIAEYYRSGISLFDFFTTITLRTLLGRDNMWQGKIEFMRRGCIEQDILRKVKYVIGRTEWDRTHSQSINRFIQYFHCNETLRTSFYQNRWIYSNCNKYTIFLSQSSYPIKGLHQVIKAVSLLKDKYPDIKILVAGTNILKSQSLIQRCTISGYGKYIDKLIKKHNLVNNVLFLGPLSEKDICIEYLKCNLFILPSSIENSPNSLCEAQIMGTPCIASYVGGVPDFMNGAERWLYRFEDYRMLADKIDKAFIEIDTTQTLAETEYLRNQAIKRHSPNLNNNSLINIYKQIISLENED